MKKTDKPEGFFHQIWKFFSSVKLSIVILLTLAGTSIIGTLIPQNENPMYYRHEFGPTLYAVFSAIDAFDMYHSWWFRFLLCLLIVNIVICSINRLSSTWRVIFPKKTVFNENQFKKTANRAEWMVDAPPDTVKDVLAPYINGHFRQTRIDPTDDGLLIFAERGRWTRLGVYVVHVSVLLMIIGGLIGSIFGFDGYVNIPEGSTVSSVSLDSAGHKQPLGFSIRCDKFSIDLYPSGMPKEYLSKLSIIKSGKVILKKNLRVNHPLRYAGINIFQASYGKTAGNHFTVVFSDNSSGLQTQKKAAMGDPIELPGQAGTLEVVDYTDGFDFHGHNIGPCYLARLKKKGSPPREILLSLNYPRFDRMRNGDYTIFVKDVDYRYYTGLQVTRDPGVPVVYAGFILMIAGCYITFFMFHKKICVRLAKSGSRTTVTLSGISGRNRPGMKTTVDRLAKRFQHLTRDAHI